MATFTASNGMRLVKFWPWSAALLSGCVSLFASEFVYAQSPAALNDTGIIICYGPSSPCDPVLHKKQDAMVGRDAAARSAGSGLTTNTGKGFSFTKISRSGVVMADSAVLGDAPTDWACSRDNVTGLIWEVKTDSPTNYRYKLNTYTWYNPDPGKNGGLAGTQNGGGCSNAGRCDTEKYIQDIPAGLCGKSNWRLPIPKELQNILDVGRQVGDTVLVTSFFPTFAPSSSPATNNHTSVVAAANSSQSWYVNYFNGGVSRVSKDYAGGIMAVAGP